MIWLYLTLGAVAVIGGLVWYLTRTARGEGRAEERAASAIKGLEQARDANEIDENVVRLPDGELADRLRKLRGE